MPDLTSSRSAVASGRPALTLAELDVLETFVQRIAGFMIRATAVAERTELHPCLDYWATRERLARVDDAVFAGRRLLQRLIAP